MARDNGKGKRISKDSRGHGKGKRKEKGNGKRKEKGKGASTSSSSRATMQTPTRATVRTPSPGPSPSTPPTPPSPPTQHVIRRPKPRSHSQGDAGKNAPIKPARVDIHGGQ